MHCVRWINSDCYIIEIILIIETHGFYDYFHYCIPHQKYAISCILPANVGLQCLHTEYFFFLAFYINKEKNA